MKEPLRILLVILISLVTVEIAVAARAPDRIERDVVLSEECSRSVLDALKISVNDAARGLKFPVDSFGSSEVGNGRENYLQIPDSSHRSVKIGPYWQDRAGAIPRLRGPRYEFSSKRVESPAQLASFWQKVREAAMRNSGTRNASDNRIIGDVSLCKGADNVRLIVFEIPGYENQYGKQGRQLQVVLQVGEELPELKVERRSKNQMAQMTGLL